MTQSAINWPQEYLPGTTDNFVSNEIVVRDINAKQVWAKLIDTSTWSSYYSNAKDVKFHDGGGPILKNKSSFEFNTFGFKIEAEILEFEPPKNSHPGRISWHGWCGTGETRLDVVHSWLVEDLGNTSSGGNRCRILTQESQKGKPAIKMATSLPNPMINGHQEWITGLANSVKNQRPQQ